MNGLPRQSDVVIIGGGAAGLAAARHLTGAGVEAVLLEAAPRLGGRIVTDIVDGFRLDRGFQVVNTAYPALPHFVDIGELDLRFFDHAVLVADGHGRHLLADPRRRHALDSRLAGARAADSRDPLPCHRRAPRAPAGTPA